MTFASSPPKRGRSSAFIDGDLRMAEFGSWPQPTKADYYMGRLCRLSVLHRRRKTAKAQGMVQRARNAMAGGPVGGSDHTVGDLDARAEIAGHTLRNIAE